MTIDFYKNFEDNRKVNKTNIQLLQKKAGVQLKQDTNFKNPSFILEYFQGIESANYLWWEEYNNYYYINSLDFSQQRVILNCSIDVLMSYRTDILNLECIIDRQKTLYNQYLDDSEYKIYNYRRTQTFPFPSGLNNPCFVLAVAGEV